MSQLAVGEGQPGNREEPDFFLRRLETVRFQENGWQEPCESRDSCTDLRGTGGEIPPVYPTMNYKVFSHTGKVSAKSNLFPTTIYGVSPIFETKL